MIDSECRFSDEDQKIRKEAKSVKCELRQNIHSNGDILGSVWALAETHKKS